MRKFYGTRSEIYDSTGNYRTVQKPYNLIQYYSETKKTDQTAAEYEKIIRHMTMSLNWCKNTLRPISEDEYAHDYYEIVEYRKHFLRVYEVLEPELYREFIEKNPTMRTYIELPTRNK